MKPTKKFSVILMTLFAFILSAMTIAVIYAMEQFVNRQNQITKAILQGDELAIKTLEGTAPKIQKQIIKDVLVKKALVHFYLQQTDHPILHISKTYDDALEVALFKDEWVYRTLMAHYDHQINVEIKADNFDKAFLLLESLKSKYPSSRELSEKSKNIQDQKRIRLAFLIQQYVKEINQALTKKNYEHAEKVLLDWQTLLPTPSEQRDLLQKRLALYQQFDNIIVDLTGYDDQKIVNRLDQLTIAPALQKEVLKMVEVQKSLLRYHLNEALALMRLKKPEINLEPRMALRLEEILAAAHQIRSDTVQEIVKQLQTCEAHYKANRLTTGKPGTALDCYQAILKKYPGNIEALKGLKKLESRYEAWAKAALQQNKLDKVKIYLAGIKRVNPTSLSLKRLEAALMEAE